MRPYNAHILIVCIHIHLHVSLSLSLYIYIYIYVHTEIDKWRETSSATQARLFQGSDPAKLAQAAKIVESYGYDEAILLLLLLQQMTIMLIIAMMMIHIVMTLIIMTILLVITIMIIMMMMIIIIIIILMIMILLLLLLVIIIMITMIIIEAPVRDLLYIGGCEERTLLRRRIYMGQLVNNASNQGLDSSCCCWIAGPRIPLKGVVCSQTPAVAACGKAVSESRALQMVWAGGRQGKTSFGQAFPPTWYPCSRASIRVPDKQLINNKQNDNDNNTQP